jgi:hypothetical protein
LETVKKRLDLPYKGLAVQIWKHGEQKLLICVVSRELRRMSEKSCVSVVGNQIGTRTETVEGGQERKEGLGLMGAWKGHGWYSD